MKTSAYKKLFCGTLRAHNATTQRAYGQAIALFKELVADGRRWLGG